MPALAVSAFATSTFAASAKTARTCAAVKGDTVDARRVAVGQGFETVRLIERGDATQRILLCRDGAAGRRVVPLTRIYTDGGTYTESIADGAIAADGSVVLQGQNLSDADPPATFWYAFSPAGQRTASRRIDGTGTTRQPLRITDAGGFAYVGGDGTIHGVDATGDHALSSTTGADLATGGNRVYWTEGDAPRSATLSGRATLS